MFCTRGWRRGLGVPISHSVSHHWQDLIQWNTLLRTTTLIFERLDDIKAMFWKSLSMRESAHGLYKACIRTCFQRIIEITMFRQNEDKAKGKRSHLQIWKEYDMKLPAATAPTAKEPVTETMVAQVYTIYSKHFTEHAMKIVQDTELRATCLVNFLPLFDMLLFDVCDEFDMIVVAICH